MARIAGVDLPRNKRMEVALTYIYGIGRSTSRKILHEVGVSLDKKSDAVDDEELVKIRQFIDAHLKVEGDLRRDVAGSIKRLMDIGAYRDMHRHRRCQQFRQDYTEDLGCDTPPQIAAAGAPGGRVFCPSQ